jgi:hypothetical protein
MGAKGYFNPRMKTKDFNKKRYETVQKLKFKRVYKKYNSGTTRHEKRA